jgi:hypothetical protein
LLKEKGLTDTVELGIMGVGSGDNVIRGIGERGMANSLRRPPSYVLSSEEIKGIKEDALSIGVPIEVLRFNEGKRTGFRDKSKTISVRGDILPDLENGTSARDKMPSRAVLAHEYYGHYRNHPSPFEPDDWRDEFFASFNAAFDTPNLTREERIMLVQDAYDRQKAVGAFEGYSEKAWELLYGD